MLVIVAVTCMLATVVPTVAGAQQVRSEEELYFTYIGPVFETGFSSVDYKKWDHSTDVRDSRSSSGMYYSGGVVLDIFVHYFIGEFSLQCRDAAYADSEVSAIYLRTAAIGKYFHQFDERFFADGGFGIYMETGPANRKYDGGGGIAAVIGVGYSFTREWRIMLDFTAGWGRYGIAEEAANSAFGVKLAVLYKIGRL